MNKSEIFDDEYSGQGGCYVVDSATGKRMPEADFLAAQQAEAERQTAQQGKSAKTKPAADAAINTTGV